ncbi:hypothetical protein [Roseovarius salinarum]|uniref:hypothetical protein n=1 Tax=Roseovarius salinarum TaxID=1981892 RepID=UPI0012FFD3EA|nr:hypothetical protein [Roseovarius salinarum]
MTHTSITAARDAAPASWGAHGLARGSGVTSLETLDRTNRKRHHETTLRGVVTQ